MIYDNELVFIESATSAQDRVTRIDGCIDALLNTVLKAAATANIQEYTLNNSQDIIKMNYRNPETIVNVINALEMMRSIYVNRINSRIARLHDSKNLINGYRC